MANKLLYSVFESGFVLDISTLCATAKIEQLSFSSNRKMIAQIKKSEPDFIVAEFIYSPSLGTQISSLDGLLGSVERYCHNTQVIIYTETRYRDKLETIREKFTLHHVLEYPIKPIDICSIIQ